MVMLESAETNLGTRKAVGRESSPSVLGWRGALKNMPTSQNPIEKAGHTEGRAYAAVAKMFSGGWMGNLPRTAYSSRHLEVFVPHIFLLSELHHCLPVIGLALQSR